MYDSITERFFRAPGPMTKLFERILSFNKQQIYDHSTLNKCLNCTLKCLSFLKGFFQVTNKLGFILLKIIHLIFFKELF